MCVCVCVCVCQGRVQLAGERACVRAEDTCGRTLTFSPHHPPHTGSEDATYIYVDLTDADPTLSLNPGGTLRLNGLGGSSPTLARSGGRPPLVGEWRESVGSLLFAAAAGGDGDPGGYVAHTERVLYFGGGGGGGGGGSRSRSMSVGDAAAGQ